MSTVRDRDAMVAGMAPLLRPGGYVFVSVPALPAGADPLMTFREDEGLTLVLPQEQADRLALRYDLVLAWITLTVPSALDGVGLTAAVSTALADQQISCNVVAATHHDHLFVPSRDAERAVRVLHELAAATSQRRR